MYMRDWNIVDCDVKLPNSPKRWKIKIWMQCLNIRVHVIVCRPQVLDESWNNPLFYYLFTFESRIDILMRGGVKEENVVEVTNEKKWSPNLSRGEKGGVNIIIV